MLPPARDRAANSWRKARSRPAPFRRALDARPRRDTRNRCPRNTRREATRVRAGFRSAAFAFQERQVRPLDCALRLARPSFVRQFTRRSIARNGSFEIHHHVHGIGLRVFLQISADLVVVRGKTGKRLVNSVREEFVVSTLVENLARLNLPRAADAPLAFHRKSRKNELAHPILRALV